jgi:hypothetical protein
VQAQHTPTDGTSPTRRQLRTGTVAAGAVAVFALAAGAGLAAFGSGVGPPTPRVSSAPQHVTAATVVSFGTDFSPAARLECALDEAAFRPCGSPVTYRRLRLGDHQLRVRAHVGTGADSGVASYAWRVVVPARLRTTLGSVPAVPRPLMTTTPVRPYVSSNATFSWRAPAGRLWRRGTTFGCSLDGHAWARCSGPRTYRGLAPGTHVFRVRARRLGVRSRANRFTWTIGLDAPTVPTITSRPPATTSSPDVSFTFEADGAAGFECRLDGGFWQRCSSPVAFVGLAPGLHELCVRAVSSDGTAGPAQCARWVQTASSDPQPSSPPATDPFTISGDLSTLLAPGTGGPLALTVTNPNGFDLLVSWLVVTVGQGSSKPGCDGATNLQVVQSNTASGAASIVVPAGGSVTLPAQGATAPRVEMLDLATNQDACKGAVFTLSYGGSGSRN